MDWIRICIKGRKQGRKEERKEGRKGLLVGEMMGVRWVGVRACIIVATHEVLG